MCPAFPALQMHAGPERPYLGQLGNGNAQRGCFVMRYVSKLSCCPNACVLSKCMTALTLGSLVTFPMAMVRPSSRSVKRPSEGTSVKDSMQIGLSTVMRQMQMPPCALVHVF